MAGGSIEIGKRQCWGERASARRSPALPLVKNDPGIGAGVTELDFTECSIYDVALVI
jgi:hypothetical protein